MKAYTHKTHTAAHFLYKHRHTMQHGILYNGIQYECQSSLSWRACVLKYHQQWVEMNADGSIALHPAIVTSTKLPNQPSSPFSSLYSLSRTTCLTTAQAYHWKQTTWSALSPDLISQCQKSQHTIWKSHQSAEGLFPEEPIFHRLHFPQSDHHSSDDTRSEWC